MPPPLKICLPNACQSAVQRVDLGAFACWAGCRARGVSQGGSRRRSRGAAGQPAVPGCAGARRRECAAVRRPGRGLLPALRGDLPLCAPRGPRQCAAQGRRGRRLRAGASSLGIIFWPSDFFSFCYNSLRLLLRSYKLSTVRPNQALDCRVVCCAAWSETFAVSMWSHCMVGLRLFCSFVGGCLCR
jgi:hypothetical protein